MLFLKNPAHWLLARETWVGSFVPYDSTTRVPVKCFYLYNVSQYYFSSNLLFIPFHINVYWQKKRYMYSKLTSTICETFCIICRLKRLKFVLRNETDWSFKTAEPNGDERTQFWIFLIAKYFFLKVKINRFFNPQNISSFHVHTQHALSFLGSQFNANTSGKMIRKKRWVIPSDV